MTAWLSEWLRDIVLIILFAAFIDLLIPNNALQRYVKVVISLIILLTILSPVITLFKADIDVKKAAEQAAAGVVQGEIPPLSSLLAEGGRIRLDAESRSARLVEAQMEEMIQERLKQFFAVRTAKVDVRITPAEQEAGAKLEEIRITLSDPGAEAVSGAVESPIRKDGQSESVSIESVEKVLPVAVDIKADKADKQSTEDGQDKPDAAPDRRLLQDRIKRHVQEWWGVDERTISVGWLDAQSAASGDSGAQGGNRS